MVSKQQIRWIKATDHHSKNEEDDSLPRDKGVVDNHTQDIDLDY